MVWSGSHLLCYYLESLGRTGKCIGSALELGAGVGLCSAVAIQAGACGHHCTTDMADPVLELASQNLQVAANAANAANARAKSVEWSVAQLNWGDEAQIDGILRALPHPAHANETRFDTVFAAEVIYPDIDVQTLNQLFKTVDLMLVTGGAFICAFVERNALSVTRMLEVAGKTGWQLDLIPSTDFLPRYESSTATRVHAMEGAKLLKFTRAAQGGCNNGLGEADCSIFPGLKARLQRMTRAAQEVEEWVAPFATADL